MLQPFMQHSFLEHELRGTCIMLQAAAATHGKKRAGGRNSFGSRRNYLLTHGFGITAFIGGKSGQHLFARQCAINEYNLAFMMGNTSALMAEFANMQSLWFFG